MLFKFRMVRDTQDNEPNPWSSIGLQAAMIVNRLRCQSQLNDNSKEEDRGVIKQDQQPDDSKKEKSSETERADIERRMRDILAMENRLRRESRK